MGKAETLSLALTQTDADNVRQAVCDEPCLYVCRQCGEIAPERLPF